jgi:hypothetical protein
MREHVEQVTASTVLHHARRIGSKGPGRTDDVSAGARTDSLLGPRAVDPLDAMLHLNAAARQILYVDATSYKPFSARRAGTLFRSHGAWSGRGDSSDQRISGITIADLARNGLLAIETSGKHKSARLTQKGSANSGHSRARAVSNPPPACPQPVAPPSTGCAIRSPSGGNTE